MGNTLNAVGLIKTIANKLRDGKLENISSVEKETAKLGDYLGTDQMQTIIFAAIFSKRMEHTSSSIDQTENAIQNIILEQMEKQQGILIATTNLEGNLDAAFERRFLFKIKFEKPGKEAKKLIWQDKLPLLAESDAGALAAEYDFSGGEIDNIVRKATMNEVLTGNGYSLDYIRELCSQERLSKKRESIGFC